MLRNARGTVLLTLALALTPALAACGSQPTTVDATSEEVAVETGEDIVSESTSGLTPGTYECEVVTDSSMFRAYHCTLEVKEDGTYLAHLALPGEGFSRLYFGTAEAAATAPDDEIYDYHVGNDGLYTFDIPVSALDEDLPVAAYGQRRDTWYDHTINFATPVA
jgi:hypothetical protein